MHKITSLATTSKGFPVRATSASTSGTRSRENIGKKLVIDAGYQVMTFVLCGLCWRIYSKASIAKNCAAVRTLD